MPTSVLGRWAVGAALLWLVLLGWVFFGLNSGLMMPGSAPALIVGTSMAIAGPVTLVLAAVGLWKYRDRTWSVILAGVCGFLGSILFFVELSQPMVG
ncbi:hypothetical protein [Raineyella fluvialis]|uniref:hypothetical protein n=1 Tax=Raineyella fluvialis TaxID=2662261 RepID=UPI001E4B3418|nr:hypothetical protein [Raineyella fluvialis]